MAGVMFEEKSTAISTAIRINDIELLRNALKNEDAHHTDRKGNTYLHYVCTLHRPCIFHILVSSGINVNAQNRHGNTALHVTALQNDCSHVGDLLAAGIDPTIKNKNGQTAAEIETKNRFWRTVYDKYQPGIFQAVEEHNVEKVLYLLHCWCRVDAKRESQTLRQYAASRKFHDLVFHIDKHQHTLGMIYAILEGDSEKAAHFLLHNKCDVNLLNYASEISHILQHALKMKDSRQVRMICRAKANLNVRVTLNCYLKAPLFFAAFDPDLPVDIMWTILKSGPDFTLKDERGRNAAIYALDKMNRKVPYEVIAHMMANGLDFSQRDMTGVTLRDVARFARRKDILDLIDKAFVKVIRSSNIKELTRLCIMGYDGMFITFNYRDTYIYACGNETEDALHFIQQLPKIRTQVRQLHHGIHHWSKDKVHDLLSVTEWPEILLNARDKGGRTSVHLAILHWRHDLLGLFLSMENCIVDCAVDNVGRSPYHYACCIEEDVEREQLCQILEEAWGKTEVRDYKDKLPEDMIGKADSAQWIQQERKTYYGMVRQLECVDKYEELCCMMTYKSKNLKHFENSVSRFRYPVAKFHKILAPLMPEFRDLVLVAMDNKKEDIAVRLIQLGANYNLTDWVNAHGDATFKKAAKKPHIESINDGNQIEKNEMGENITQLCNLTPVKNGAMETKNKERNELKSNTFSAPDNWILTSLETDLEVSEEKLEKVTVEERALRLGMSKVCLAINKKKIHMEKKRKNIKRRCSDDSSSSSTCHNKTSKVKGDADEKAKNPTLGDILSPIRVSGSRTNNDDLENELSKGQRVATANNSNHDILFEIESLKYESDTDDGGNFYDDKSEAESRDQSDSDNSPDDNYSDDEFFSENSFTKD
ncbi:ankyrin-1-like [Plakobranchus ocellatus]|uniref:Ankyrin-1-like n=1 Tax=Plakobranchus ocellatus TaxID=259542 RepID=A0AAV3Y3Q1_9GAST|nr:ankyrin-1-like [Plakobranchus ocellatus]